MNQITEVFNLEIPSLITGAFLVLAAIIAGVEIIGKFSQIIGKPVSWVKKRNQDHVLLSDTINSLNNLQDKHMQDIKESNDHDIAIQNEISELSHKIDDMLLKFDQMQHKIDETEMAKLKNTLVAYYKKHKDGGEWTQFESDAFWGLYDRYISHGGNSFVKNVIKPVMENLKIID